MEGRHEPDKSVDDFMMPGFRFHPTDEELVGFYLKRKLQLRPLPIELIKQVDIYKYDPWDLPKLASTGEKEWYFYCPRDRKYRNSTRPNRVTGSGFWKATGTDRLIYSSDGARCIGLKKSLVFYRGRAAKGIKTDWMMHEFRLPSTMDGAAAANKKVLDKNLPPTDSWAICRIFKKTTSMANRALTTHPWPSSTSPDGYIYNTSSTTGQDFQQTNLSAVNIPLFRISSTFTADSGEYFPENVGFSPPQQASGRTTADPTSMLFNPPPFQPCKASESIQFDGHSDISSNTLRASTPQWGDNIRSIGFPFSLPDSWDSPPEISSTTYSTNKC